VKKNSDLPILECGGRAQGGDTAFEFFETHSPAKAAWRFASRRTPKFSRSQSSRSSREILNHCSHLDFAPRLC
jgi:hypothetical protein